MVAAKDFNNRFGNAGMKAEILNGMGAPVDLMLPEEDVSREVAAATLCLTLEGLNLIWD